MKLPDTVVIFWTKQEEAKSKDFFRESHNITKATKKAFYIYLSGLQKHPFRAPSTCTMHSTS